MNASDYERICQACDELLLSPESTTTTLAIPWLHVIRPHPTFLFQYENINKKINIKELIQKFKRVAFLLAGVVYDFCQCGFEKNEFIQKNNSSNTDEYILFVSHLISPEKINGEDFYFGLLPEILSKKDHKILVVLIDHTRKFIPSGKYIENNLIKLVLPASMGWQAEFGFIKMQILESIRLRRRGKSEKNCFKRDVIYRASREAMANGTRKTLRIGAQIHTLVKKYKCKTVVTTYEGHSWERIVYSSAREAKNDIQCIGYMHAPLFNLQHACKRGLYAEHNPNRILTLGKVAEEGLKNCLDFPVSIESIGSLRPKNDDWYLTGNHKVNKSILVIPEGIDSECALLFNLSLNCALKNPELEFIWRLHPLITVEYLRRLIKNFNKIPNNIKISRQSIGDDIKEAKWVLYRGSSAVFQAIKGGLIPIYYKILDEISIDPIYEVKKQIISNEDDLIRLLSSTELIKNDNYLSELHKNYYEKIDYTKIEALITKR